MTRIGASQVFFNIVAQFNAEKLIKDREAINTVMKAVSIDTAEAIMKPMEDAAKAIGMMVDETSILAQELGFASIEFEKFFGSAADVDAMRDSVVELGMAFAMTGEEALAAGSRASQVANLIGRANVGVLTELAFTLAEISDLNAEEAQRGIIQLHQQTGMLFGELDQAAFKRLSLQEQQNILVREGAVALDALNTIANRSVALEGDLVRVMGTFAAQGELVGDSFEFMAAQSAVLLEAGEEQGTAGRALRMMYARLGGDISGARTEIESLGYEFTQSNGEMKTMQGIMEELNSKGWDRLNPAMKQNIAQTIAGNRHYVRFIKLMENYDRAVQLAADGAAGFDSATGQATKALQHQANALKIARNEQELLKAEIGEGLLPATTAYVEKQNEMLEVTKNLAKGTGPLGVGLGRLAANMKMFGGAIKLGLGIRTLGVGFEMFTSIQKQLHGILVANEHLHSKQANHLAFNVKATEFQTDILKGQQHIQQKINAAVENRRVAQYAMAPLLRQQEPIVERLKELEEDRVEIEDRLAEAQSRQNRAMHLRKKEIKFGSESAMFRVHLAKQEVLHNEHLVALAKDLYMNKSSFKDDALVRQFLTDSQMVEEMTVREKKSLVQRNNELKKTHTLLQRIKGENERQRGLGMGDDAAGIYSGIERYSKYIDANTQRSKVIGNMTSMLKEDRVLLERVIKQMGMYKQQSIIKALGMDKQAGAKDDILNMLGGGTASKQLDIALKKKFGDGADAHTQMQKYKQETMEVAFAFDSLGDKVADTTKPLSLTKMEFDGLMKAMTAYGGKIGQTEDLLRIIGEAERERINQGMYMDDATAVRKTLREALNTNLKETISLEGMHDDLQKKLAPHMKIVSDETVEQEERYRQLGIMISALTEDIKEHDKAMVAGYQKKTRLKFTDDTTKAMEKMQFSVVSLTSVVAGMAPGNFAATLSMAGLASSMQKSTFAAGKSIKAFTLLQIAEAKTAVEAKYTTQNVSSMTQGFEWAKLSAMKLGKALMVTFGPMAVLTGALYLFNKRGEETRKIVDAANNSLLQFESTISRLSSTTQALSDNNLADAIGLSNYSTNEMLSNTSLIDAEIQILTENMGMFTKEQNTQIVQALDYLKVLKAIANESATLNDDTFEKTARGARGQLTGIMDEIIADVGYGVPFSDDMESMTELFSQLGLQEASSSKGFIPMLRENLNQIIDLMKDGTMLTQEQIELFDKAYDDDDLTALLETMNGLVLTEEKLAYAQASVNDAIDKAGNNAQNTATEIENLTAEIYNFSGARDELFFGGQYGNVTGSLYKQVVQQGVGTLYHKNEVIMTTNFHGFFNEQEAADRITRIVTDVLAS